jgi:hypothetical protein
MAYFLTCTRNLILATLFSPATCSVITLCSTRPRLVLLSPNRLRHADHRHRQPAAPSPAEKGKFSWRRRRPTHRPVLGRQRFIRGVHTGHVHPQQSTSPESGLHSHWPSSLLGIDLRDLVPLETEPRHQPFWSKMKA